MSNQVSCTNPIEAAVLADYWIGALSPQEEQYVEEHFLVCQPCSERLGEVIELAEGIRKLARSGSLRMIVSETFLKRAAEQGLRVRQYAPPAGGGVQCTVKAEDDLLVARLAANLRGAQRVDLCFFDERGVEQNRMRDVPVHSAAKSIAYQESITFAKSMPTSKMFARLVSVDEAGSDRTVAEYTFNHTRSLPGPGADFAEDQDAE